MTPSHHSQDSPFREGPLAGAPTFNIPQNVLTRSPLVLITEHLTITGFAPTSASTLYGPLGCEPPPVYPVASPTREAPSAFMQPLNRVMNSRSANLHTLSHRAVLPSFREPYPVVNPLTAPTTFVHSQNPWPISGDTHWCPQHGGLPQLRKSTFALSN